MFKPKWFLSLFNKTTYQNYLYLSLRFLIDHISLGDAGDAITNTCLVIKR